MLSIYTDACKIALRALIHLARLPEERPVSVRSLLEGGDYPEAGLAKVLQRLAARGILRSSRGVRGGFTLGRAPDEISLADVIEAVDGVERARACALSKEICSESSWCPIHEHWFKARTTLSEMMRSTTIADLARLGAHARRADSRTPRARAR